MNASSSSAPLVWITAPPAGGRAGLAAPLVTAFQRIGARAEEMSFRLIEKHLDVSLSPEERGRAVVTEFWTRFRREPPALLLDLSPLPPDLVLAMRQSGTATAYWLIEDALDPAYAYWRETVPAYDLFLTFQGAPFAHPGAHYLAWGAAGITAPPTCPPTDVILHGAVTPHREAFLHALAAELGEPPLPLRVVGPGWARLKREPWPNGISFESRWTDPAATESLLAGQIVLVPQSRSVNAVAPRLWETLAFGACVIAEEMPLLADHFTIGQDLFSFRTPAEAATHLKKLAVEPTIALEIARAGQAAIARDGLLAHRAAAILKMSGLA
jgi:hypothetical protein